MDRSGGIELRTWHRDRTILVTSAPIVCTSRQVVRRDCKAIVGVRFYKLVVAAFWHLAPSRPVKEHEFRCLNWPLTSAVGPLHLFQTDTVNLRVNLCVSVSGRHPDNVLTR